MRSTRQQRHCLCGSLLGKLRVSLLVEVDVDEIVTTRMRKAMRERPNDWKLMSDAALYCVDQEIHMGEALAGPNAPSSANSPPTSR